MLDEGPGINVLLIAYEVTIPQVLLYFVCSQQTSRASTCANNANMTWLGMPLVEDAVGRVHGHGGRGEHSMVFQDFCGAVVGWVSILLSIYERLVIMAISSVGREASARDSLWNDAAE